MTNQSFEARQKQLIKEWEEEVKGAETEDEVGHAILDLFLKSERLRRGVEAPSPEQTVVDFETVEKLGDARSLGPEFSFAEAAFRRLVDDPASAIKYIEQSRANFSQAQSRAAQKLRPTSYDPFTVLINDWVTAEPNIKAKQIGERLRKHSDIDYDRQTGEFSTEDRYTLKESNIASRVSDAKKRVSG